MAMLIICLFSAGLSLISSLLSPRLSTRRRIACVIALILFIATITLGVLGYWDSVENEDQIQLAHDKASDASALAVRAQAQITEIRTPRRMERETKHMLVAKLKPYAWQKYDMKVFRDQDSLELATAIQAIMEEAGWVRTNVYPTRYAKRYAETPDPGVWLISGKGETTKTSEARTALHGALNEAGLYDDSTAFTPVNCAEITGPIQKGTKVTPIPCSESPIQIIAIDFTSHDDVIPEDTLVLHVGQDRP